MVIAGGPLSLDLLKAHPRGMFIDVPPTIVQTGNNDPAARFEVAPDDVVEELEAYRVEDRGSAEYPYRLISRRMREMLNTTGLNFPVCRAREPYNPAYLNPQDLAAIGSRSNQTMAFYRPSQRSTIRSAQVRYR